MWLLFGAGMTVLAISESLWIAYQVVGQPLPYPSLVDISWAIGFIPILISLVLQYRALHVQLSRRQKLSILAAYVGVLIIIVALSLGYVMSHPGEVAAMQMLVGVYYLVGDLGVAFLATLSLVYLGGGSGGATLGLHGRQHSVVCGRRSGLLVRDVDEYLCDRQQFPQRRSGRGLSGGLPVGCRRRIYPTHPVLALCR